MMRRRIRGVFVAVCTTALAGTVAAVGVPGASAAEFATPTFVRTIGHPGHAGVYAWGAATAIDGSILIGDYWNYTIRRYSKGGTLLQSISSKGTGPGQNMGPHGVAVDPNDGSIYLADMNAPWQIDKFDAQGNHVRTFSTYVRGVTVPYPYVTRLAVDSQGLVYAVSSHNVPTTFSNRVVVFNPDGTYRSSFGVNGTAPGQLGLVHGIDIGPNDEVYLADATKGVVQVFSSTGTYLRSFGTGRFRGDMRGVRVDKARGWVYVVDTDASQVEKFTLDGTWLTAWGSEGTGPGQFRDGGRELAVDGDGNVHAPDFGNFRINVYSPTGTYLRTYPSPAPAPAPDGFNQAQDVAVRPDGESFYTADTYNHRVQRFNAIGDVVNIWGFRGTTAPQAMNYPRGVAVDPNSGEVLLLNSREGNIKRYSPSGTFISEFGSWGSAAGQYNLPRGISTDGSRVYIADSNNRRVQVVSLTGEPILSMPCGLAPAGTGPQLLGGCTGITTDADGNIYAAAVTEHVVYKWSPTGVLLAKFGTLGSANGQLRAPYDVAIHDGLLYVSESNNNRVSAFTLDGAFAGRFGSKGSGDGQLWTPRGISIDGDGTIYVMDSQNERVQVFQIP
jgi:tripartite motif-containing protein 71